MDCGIHDRQEPGRDAGLLFFMLRRIKPNVGRILPHVRRWDFMAGVRGSIFGVLIHTKRKNMKVRVLVASNEDASIEEVFFTEDFDTPAEDFFFQLEVSTDTVIECNLPDDFPFDYNLQRKN